METVSMLETAVALGFLFAILLIVFLFNPPEAWIKRIFRLGKKKPEK